MVSPSCKIFEIPLPFISRPWKTKVLARSQGPPLRLDYRGSSTSAGEAGGIRWFGTAAELPKLKA